MGWIDMALIRERWWALVNAVARPRGPIQRSKFLDKLKTC
jgi:hypothetical protein